MGPHDSFLELAARLRAGDQGAAPTSSAASPAGSSRWHCRTQRPSRRKLDPEDVVQSVYRSFFGRYQAGQFDLATWDALWSLLTVITVRKCLNRTEYYLAQCRNVAGEIERRLGVMPRSG